MCAEPDDFEDGSDDLLSRAHSAALKATDAIKEAADEISRFGDEQRRSVGARATARARTWARVRERAALSRSSMLTLARLRVPNRLQRAESSRTGWRAQPRRWFSTARRSLTPSIPTKAALLRFRWCVCPRRIRCAAARIGTFVPRGARPLAGTACANAALLVRGAGALRVQSSCNGQVRCCRLAGVARGRDWAQSAL